MCRSVCSFAAFPFSEDACGLVELCLWEFYPVRPSLAASLCCVSVSLPLCAWSSVVSRCLFAARRAFGMIEQGADPKSKVSEPVYPQSNRNLQLTIEAPS